MLPHVVRARWEARYTLRLEFSDGASGTIDFEKRIVGRGGVFQQLEDLEQFRRFTIDPEAGTIVWPNGVDFCPVMLHRVATGRDTEAA